MPTFYIAPGAEGVSLEEDELLRAHEDEAQRQGAKFYNYGWVQGAREIASKTSKGVLATDMDATGKISHHWRER